MFLMLFIKVKVWASPSVHSINWHFSKTFYFPIFSPSKSFYVTDSRSREPRLCKFFSNGVVCARQNLFPFFRYSICELANFQPNKLYQIPVQHTPEVAAPFATDDSLPVASTNTLISAVALSVPVQDTPEVAAAKRDHAAQWLAAKAATDAAILRNSVAVVPAAAVAAPVSGSVVSTPVGTPLINTHSLAAHPLAYTNMIGQHPLAYSNMMINPWGYNYPLSHLGYNYGVLPSAMTGQRFLIA